MSESDSVAKKVRKALQERPSIAEGLKLGIVNYSALARLLADRLGISNTEAVVSAIKRFAESSVEGEHDKRLRRVVSESSIELRPNIAVITLPPGSDWKKLASALSVHHIVQGPSSTNLVVDERSISKADPSLVSGLEIRHHLAAITIKRPVEATATPGVVVYFLASIASAGVNLEETLTCNADQVLLFKLNDAQKAFLLLNDVIINTRDSKAI
jgi:hypothetical protein